MSFKLFSKKGTVQNQPLFFIIIIKKAMELKYFTIEELCVSETARKHKINNKPNNAAERNLIELIVRVLDPIRNCLKQPVYVSSGYRSAELNRLVGGSATSQHLTGEAADIYLKNASNGKILQAVETLNLNFDQLILEKGTMENPQWVHISYRSPLKNRNEIMYYNGKTYKKIK